MVGYINYLKDCIDKYQNSSSIENLGVEFEVIVQFYSENRSQLDLILLFAEHNKSLRTLNSSKNNIENLNSNFRNYLMKYKILVRD